MKNVTKFAKASVLTMLVCCMILVNQSVASAASGPQVDFELTCTSPGGTLVHPGDILDYSFYLVNYNVPGSTPLLNTELSFYFLDGFEYVADSVVIKKNGVVLQPELETTKSYLVFGTGDVNPGDILQITFSAQAVKAGYAQIRCHVGFDNDLVRRINQPVLESETGILVQ